ncbi:MAG: hypothetical protein R3C99_26730 [Pirellulaceae bacterium]
MPGKAARIEVTERQYELLEKIVASRTASVRLVQRAKIVLLAFSSVPTMRRLANWSSLNPQQVSVWRKRWRDDWQRLISVECTESLGELKKQIEQLFADRPRSGKASRFSTEQQAAIVSIACENPDAESHVRSHGLLLVRLPTKPSSEALSESISVSHVRTFLNRADVQPHRNKYWLFKIDDRES